ncbi:WD40 repeat domain-containing protein [Reichenbachiella ulvae]|uniref:WD40 repeat domain-containing protein n=1 Tax=Reichenbachiella ulvae TaxID=2980104 RepID=A0ABT3CTT7_9BACT|nr:WD40 repeat domain-containing protein [Reichenbachiella ulvae]MCV9386895.1 WD40 repeat domain-containing protein [Reichenbachiella ulvae]
MCALPKVNIKKVHSYTGHQDAVYTLESGSSPQYFFSAGGDGQVILWDLENFENGRLIAKVSSSIYSLCYIPEIDVLIVGQNYEGLHLIKIEEKSAAGSLQLGKLAIFDIKVHQGLVLVACASGEFFIIDLKTLNILKRSVISDQNLRRIEILRDNTCVIAASDGQLIRVDLKSFNIVDQTMAHDNSVFGLAYHSDQEVLLTGSRDARLKYWDVKDGEELIESINAHMYAINDIDFHPSEKYFATASMDKTVKVWEYEERRLIKVIDKARHQGHLTSVNRLIWTEHHDYLISCSDDRSISVWDIDIVK